MNRPPVIRIVKPVFNYKKKTPEQVINTLKLAAAEAMRQHPGYKLDAFKGPELLPDGAALYVIIFKICASPIQ